MLGDSALDFVHSWNEPKVDNAAKSRDSATQDNQNGSRLESWGEIAAYLRRDVRTVQRWERDEALPVHRHQHRERGTVYAYTGEIDRWYKERRSRPEPEPEPPAPPEPAPPAPQESVLRKKWAVWLALTALILVLAYVKGLPSIARYYNNRGVQLQRSRQIKAAIEDYQWAIRLNSGY